MSIASSTATATAAGPSAALIDWRARCRAEAERTATDEARLKWGVIDDADIPFNFRWEHAQQVVRTSLWLAKATGADPEVAEAAAWLHDVRKMEPNHGQAGALAAQEILPETDFPAEKIPAVVEAILHHEGLVRADELGAPAPPLQSLVAAVLWDADKLTKVGVQSLAYYLSGHHVRGLTLSERRQKSARFVETVLTRTVASMNTEPGRRLATRRLNEMRTMLAAWARDEMV